MIRRRKPYRAFREFAPTMPCPGCGKLTSKDFCHDQCRRDFHNRRYSQAVAESSK